MLLVISLNSSLVVADVVFVQRYHQQLLLFKDITIKQIIEQNTLLLFVVFDVCVCDENMAEHFVHDPMLVSGLPFWRHPLGFFILTQTIRLNLKTQLRVSDCCGYGVQLDTTVPMTRDLPQILAATPSR